MIGNNKFVKIIPEKVKTIRWIVDNGAIEFVLFGTMLVVSRVKDVQSILYGPV